MRADTSDDREGAEIAMGKFLGQSRSFNVTGVQVYLVSNLILWSQIMPLVVISYHIVLGLGKGSFGLFQRLTHLPCKIVHSFHGRSRMGFESHARVTASVEHEGSILSGGVDVVIILELHHGD